MRICDILVPLPACCNGYRAKTVRVMMALAIACVHPLFGQQAVSAPGPDEVFGRISVDAPVFEFGTVEEGTFVRHSFIYRNTGNAPLRLEKAVVTCGCTSPKFSKEPLAPGDSSIIEVIFDTWRRPGPQDKTVTILTDGRPSQVQLRVMGEVEAVAKHPD